MSDSPKDTTPTLSPELVRAVDTATGRVAPADDARAIVIRGAWNDYNAKGRGSTTARRVLRDGVWKWVSAPASSGRFRAADRHDVRHGDVWVGEIVAQYTLGARRLAPDYFYLVWEADKPLLPLEFVRRRDGQYGLTLPGGEVIIITDPAWR